MIDKLLKNPEKLTIKDFLAKYGPVKLDEENG
jgi:hypothetical protein